MKTTLQLEQLACPTCAKMIETALQNTKGVIEVKVLYNASQAKVIYDELQVDSKKLSQVITHLGYEVEKII